jgi:hypothetical protein
MEFHWKRGAGLGELCLAITGIVVTQGRARGQVEDEQARAYLTQVATTLRRPTY